MKRIEKENGMFVVNQPTHAIMSIVFIGTSEYPLTESIHDDLYELSTFSDIVFIFYKDGAKGINKDRFCNLYSGSAWVEESKSIVKSLLFVGEYDKNIFQNHTGYLIFNDIRSIPHISDKNKEKILSIVSSGTNDPILSLTRLSAEELCAIYSEPSDISSWITRPINKSDKKYTIWKSTSDIIFLRPALVSEFNTLSPEYKDSFSWDDIRYFIASAIKRLGKDNIDSNIFSVNFK